MKKLYLIVGAALAMALVPALGQANPSLTSVTECAEGGTAATLNVRVNSSNVGHVDLVATLVEPSV